MKLLLWGVLLLNTLLSADNLSAFVQAYKAKDMSTACALGRELYRANMRDEKILIASGHACAEDDYIDFIGVLQQRLGQTPSSRRATVYFSALLLKKRLISEYMYEDADLSSYTLPLTDHILSKVFEKIKNRDFRLISENPKHLRIQEGENHIEVYVKNKLHVNVYQDGKLISEHRYR